MHMTDKRKSFVFPAQYRNCFSAQKVINQNSHWHGDVRFSWPEDNFLPPRWRHCLFLTYNCMDNPIFSLHVTFETCCKRKLKTGKIQDREHFKILVSKHSLIKAMHHLVFY